MKHTNQIQALYVLISCFLNIQTFCEQKLAFARELEHKRTFYFTLSKWARCHAYHSFPSAGRQLCRG